MDRKSRVRKWGRLLLYVLAGLWWCLLSFGRTENWLVRLTAVLVWAAVTILRLISAVTGTPWLPTGIFSGIDKGLAIFFFVCGGIFVWVGARPPNTWFFGLPGIMLILNGFLSALFASSEYKAGGAKHE